MALKITLDIAQLCLFKDRKHYLLLSIVLIFGRRAKVLWYLLNVCLCVLVMNKLTNVSKKNLLQPLDCRGLTAKKGQNGLLPHKGVCSGTWVKDKILFILGEDCLWK